MIVKYLSRKAYVPAFHIAFIHSLLCYPNDNPAQSLGFNLLVLIQKNEFNNTLFSINQKVIDMAYIKFFVFSVFTYTALIVFFVTKIYADADERIFIGLLAFFVGLVAIFVFFYSNRETINEYMRSPSRNVLMKMLFRKNNEKNGENLDA